MDKIHQKNQKAFEEQLYCYNQSKKIHVFEDLWHFAHALEVSGIDQLDLSIYEPFDARNPHGYGVHLLSEIPGVPFTATAWIMAFDAKHYTKKHNHHARCIFGGLSTNHLIEETFSYNHHADELAHKESRKAEKALFYLDDLKDDYIHRLVYNHHENDGGMAYTLHIYDMPALKAEGQINRNFFKIFD